MHRRPSHQPLKWLYCRCRLLSYGLIVLQLFRSFSWIVGIHQRDFVSGGRDTDRKLCGIWWRLQQTEGSRQASTADITDRLSFKGGTGFVFVHTPYVLCFTDQYFDLCLIPPGAAQLPPPQKANQEACSPSCLLTRRGQFGQTSACDGHTTDKDRQTSCSCRHTRNSAKPSNKTWLQKPRPALWEIQSLFWLTYFPVTHCIW